MDYEPGCCCLVKRSCGKKEGAPDRSQRSCSKAPFLPRDCRRSEAPVPPLVNGRMTWDGPLSSNEGVTLNRPPRPPELLLITGSGLPPIGRTIQGKTVIAAS